MPDLNCREFRDLLMESARGTPLDVDSRRTLAAHLVVCPQCARDFEAQRVLTAAFHDLEDAVPPAEAAAMEKTLLAEFDRVNRGKHRHLAPWLAIAAALLIGAIMAGRLLVERREEPPAPLVVRIAPPAPPVLAARATPVPKHRAKLRKPAVPPADNIDSRPFVAIPYTVPLAPYERAEVVRMDLPVSAVIAAGLPLEVSDSGAQARADVLVGEDGRARAIRLLSISTFISK